MLTITIILIISVCVAVAIIITLILLYFLYLRKKACPKSSCPACPTTQCPQFIGLRINPSSSANAKKLFADIQVNIDFLQKNCPSVKAYLIKINPGFMVAQEQIVGNNSSTVSCADLQSQINKTISEVASSTNFPNSVVLATGLRQLYIDIFGILCVDNKINVAHYNQLITDLRNSVCFS